MSHENWTLWTENLVSTSQRGIRVSHENWTFWTENLELENPGIMKKVVSV